MILFEQTKPMGARGTWVPMVFVGALLLASTLALGSARAQSRFDPNDGRGKRIAVETAAGVGGTLVGGLGGALVGGLLGRGGGCRAYMCLPGGAVFGAILGAVVGQSLAVYYSGRLMGANGKYWATLVGQLAGSLGAVGVTLPGGKSQGLRASLGFMLLPLAGAVTGYELSTHATSSEPSPRQLLPLLTLQGLF